MELALVLPIFLLLIFAIVDFGMGFHAWITVTNAAREGARLGAVGGDAGVIQTRVLASAGSLDQSRLTVTVANAQGQSGESVDVGVNYRYDLITPLASLFPLVGGGSIGPTLNFSSSARMRIE